MILHTKIKALGLVVSDKKIFFMLSQYKPGVKPVTPGAERFLFWPRSII